MDDKPIVFIHVCFSLSALGIFCAMLYNFQSAFSHSRVMSYYVCFKNIYCVERTFIAAVSVDVCGTDTKRLALRAQRFPSCQRVSSTTQHCNVIIRFRVQLNWF